MKYVRLMLHAWYRRISMVDVVNSGLVFRRYTFYRICTIPNENSWIALETKAREEAKKNCIKHANVTQSSTSFLFICLSLFVGRAPASSHQITVVFLVQSSSLANGLSSHLYCTNPLGLVKHLIFQQKKLYIELQSCCFSLALNFFQNRIPPLQPIMSRFITRDDCF